MMFDWSGRGTEVLFNPRLPETDLARVREEAASLNALVPEAHFWILTSGSTSASGVGTWVAVSKDAVLCSADAVNRHLGVSSTDVWIHALPSFHVGGLGIWARAHLSGSRVVVAPEKWNASDFVRVAGQERGTLSALVPAQVHDLVVAGFRAPESLRAIVVGGGALSPSLLARARELGWPLLSSYGLTECGSQVATAQIRGARAELALLPHVQARTGADGRIEIRSGALFTGYARRAADGWFLDDPKRDGWFTTEDRGSVRDGVLLIEGRAGGFIKIGGESVHFPRLEEVWAALLLECGGIPDHALCAVPDERLGHRIVLAVAGDGGTRAVVDRFNARVLPFEAIREVVSVSEIPRSALGKVLSARLVELIREDSGIRT